MNIKKLLILAPVAVLSMTSCGKRNVRHEAKDYFLMAKHARYDTTIPAGGTVAPGMNILQLSDLHLGTNCDRKVQYAFIQKTIDLAKDYVEREQPNTRNKIDMIVITGDVFTFGTKEIAQDFVNFMEKQKIDWTMTFGNHDEQCYFSVDWLTSYLNSVSAKEDSYLLFKDNQDDDVFGNANFVIGIPDETSSGVKDEERLYIIDSNRYRYQIGSYGYDYIHYDQIDWYERMTRADFPFNSSNAEPEDRHSLAFFHIPFEEFNTYYEHAKKDDDDKAQFMSDEADESKKLNSQKEGVSCPKENTHLYDKMVELDSTKGVFVGHDHINNSSILVKGDGPGDEDNNMVLSFGVKGTDTVYADDEMIGGQIIHVTGTRKASRSSRDDDKKISVHPILHKYKDLEVK